MIQLYGIPKIFDMIHFEFHHKGKVKKPFASTSKQVGNIDNDIVRKLESRTLIVDARDTMRDILYRKDEMVHLQRRMLHTYSHKTDTDIVFEAYMAVTTQQRILYTATGEFRTRHIPLFSNPVISGTYHSSIIKDNIEMMLSDQDFESLKCNGNHMRLSYCRSFKVDATVVGLPVFSLTCARRNRETSGNTSNLYKRFDWVLTTEGT